MTISIWRILSLINIFDKSMLIIDMCRIWIMYLQPTEFKIENLFKLMTIWFTLYICISRFDILFAAVSSATNSRVEAKPSNTGDVSCFVTPFSYALHVVVKKIYICMIMFKISTAHWDWKKVFILILRCSSHYRRKKSILRLLFPLRDIIVFVLFGE